MTGFILTTESEKLYFHFQLTGKNPQTKGTLHNDIHNLSQNDDQSESSREIGEEHLKNNPDHVLTLESRPISEASSVWDEAESRNEVKRRQQQLQPKVGIKKLLTQNADSFVRD